MTPLIEKYISTQGIQDIAREKDFNDTTLQQFIEYVEEMIIEEETLYGQHYIEENLKTFIEDGCVFVKERNKGFTDAWVKIYVKQLIEENDNPAALTFHRLRPINEQEALLNLKLYCDSNMQDELCRKYFEGLVLNGNSSKDIEDRAAIYSTAYREKINGGHTILFADKYADQKTWGNRSEVGCFTYAAEYENAVLSGFREVYAKMFATDIANYIDNHRHTYDQSIADELVNLEKLKFEALYGHLK